MARISSERNSMNCKGGLMRSCSTRMHRAEWKTSRLSFSRVHLLGFAGKERMATWRSPETLTWNFHNDLAVRRTTYRHIGNTDLFVSKLALGSPFLPTLDTYRLFDEYLFRCNLRWWSFRRSVRESEGCGGDGEGGDLAWHQPRGYLVLVRPRSLRGSPGKGSFRRSSLRQRVESFLDCRLCRRSLGRRTT